MLTALPVSLIERRFSENERRRHHALEGKCMPALSVWEWRRLRGINVSLMIQGWEAVRKSLPGHLCHGKHLSPSEHFHSDIP